ncbi:unnamed protein product [Lactuca virosa]|uniref:Uncharacterized protein n=1 Tax=Lactuca virosa TaxID=75947 RepID=A0AAU9P613_9ASTR|nr:unnamed protein product [Lactuca virosa]
MEVALTTREGSCDIKLEVAGERFPNQVNATVLQYQNQKLVQQLNVQKQQLHDLEDKIKELRYEQTSYDDFFFLSKSTNYGHRSTGCLGKFVLCHRYITHTKGRVKREKQSIEDDDASEEKYQPDVKRSLLN